MRTKSYSAGNLDAWWKSMQDADRREWLRVSAEVGTYLQELAGRDDLLAVVEPGVGMGALAVYIPEKAHVEVNTDLCAEGIAPQDVNMATEVGRLTHPAFTGACTHEGSHALASKWALDQRPERRKVVAAALLLEESRAEKRMVDLNPSQRTFLRAGFHSLVKGDGAVEGIGQAARLAALAMARVDAGVLESGEMAPVRDELVAVLGEELYENLRAVWLKAQKVADEDQARMEALGQEWIDLLPEDASEEEGGIEIIICGMPGDGESSEGEGEGSGKGKSILVKVAEDIAADAEAEADEKVDAAKAHDEHVSRAREASEANASAEVAKEIFKHGAHSGGAGSEGISGSMAPTAKVLITANLLARAIEKAQHRARSKTVVSAAVPPGRLRSAAAVRRSAQRSQGIPVTAQPWKQVVRKHVDNPPITCGIMCDISGSMRWAEMPVAEAAWAIAHAIHRNEGDSATVAYGNRVHAVTKPGEAPRSMRTFNATGGTENVSDALRALDGGLNLTGGTGARLLVNISDGNYTHRQREAGQRLVKRMVASGVKVLWVDMDAHGSQPFKMDGVQVVRVRPGDDLGRVIGAAMTKALKDA